MFIIIYTGINTDFYYNKLTIFPIIGSEKIKYNLIKENKEILEDIECCLIYKIGEDNICFLFKNIENKDIEYLNVEFNDEYSSQKNFIVSYITKNIKKFETD